MHKKQTIKIGNAGGYWGDDPFALERQVKGGYLDYITLDFLAEVTMSIMQKQRARDPQQGYATDFIPMLERVLPICMNQKTKIITNAGGINPESCAQAISKMAARLGLKPKIAMVYGDDILHQVDALISKGAKFSNMESGEDFSLIKDRLESANIYFGASPVVKALESDPDIIITGRVTDTGITLAAMIHEFGWSLKDWDLLASGIVAGHLIECGAQVTGGNFTDWQRVKNFHNIGYPIIEMASDGTFVITKHAGTGGLVSLDTVREQLFYEMGNGNAYLTPDVVADFTTIQLQADGENRVAVCGVKGYEPTPFYKVSMAYRDGFKASGAIVISGPHAYAKAKAFADIFWARMPSDFAETATEYFGYNACHRSLGHAQDGEEILLKLSASDADQQKLRLFGKTIPSLILSGPPGVAVIGGVPKAQEIVSYWPSLIPKELVKPIVATFSQQIDSVYTIEQVVSGNFQAKETSLQRADKATSTVAASLCLDDKAVPLSTICLGRSGDKGDTANIGVMARSDKAYQFLESFLTAQLVKNWFQELCFGAVERHALPNLKGLNFLLHNSLGGGGTKSLRTDPQGKTFAQALLRQKVLIPKEVLDSIKE